MRKSFESLLCLDRSTIVRWDVLAKKRVKDGRGLVNVAMQVLYCVCMRTIPFSLKKEIL
jgi:hypothetical protein